MKDLKIVFVVVLFLFAAMCLFEHEEGTKEPFESRGTKVPGQLQVAIDKFATKKKKINNSHPLVILSKITPLDIPIVGRSKQGSGFVQVKTSNKPNAVLSRQPLNEVKARLASKYVQSVEEGTSMLVANQLLEKDIETIKKGLILYEDISY